MRVFMVFSPDVALEAAKAAITGGISVLEIVVSTPGVFEVLHQLVQDFPTTTLGILSLYNVGAKIVKVYPISSLGGVGYITIDLIGEYICEGASTIVLSDVIFEKEAMAQRNFTVVYQLAASQGNEDVERCYYLL
ncbi:unnamed protein product [Lactuca saligna]|uniref:Uncharacterized protein n=1 Tax=Lactuca saligna TaxID=75948 RepID=A0AA36EB27_LACSI|nr:unnamed protein product [Lactuca saligna]